MTKTIRIIIIFNGIFFPLLAGTLFAIGIINNNSTEEVEEGIYIDEMLEVNDTLALQGIRYSEPDDIYNSTNLYMPISVTTFEEARKIEKLASTAGSLNSSFYKYTNVLFLNKDYEVIRTLLNTKASIEDITFAYHSYNKDEIDTTVKNIVYSIAFEDSNKDGMLSSLDNYDLYISDLDGKNLVQATNGIDVESFYFRKSNSQIMILYTERNDIKEEHKRTKFAIFDINSSTFRELESLNNKLDDIERDLIK